VLGTHGALGPSKDPSGWLFDLQISSFTSVTLERFGVWMAGIEAIRKHRAFDNASGVCHLSRWSND
jgi:hypothetical protein